MKAPRLQSVIQRMLFAAERYREHELANHAAAGAYGFLLSVAPAILLALSLTSTLFGGNPRVVAEINGWSHDFSDHSAARSLRVLTSATG